MTWIRRAASLCRRLWNPDQVERELDAEVQAYFEILIERNMARGLSRKEAERTARIEFESPEQVKHKVRDVRTGAAMETTLRDIRHAWRVLCKAPGFTAVAVLTLALGIGANTAIFSLVNAFLLKPLKIDHPEELVGCYSVDIHKPDSARPFSYPNYIDLRDKSSIFASLAAHNLLAMGVGLTEGNTTRHVTADVVSSNYFATLGAPLFKGRTFAAAEERPDSAPVVIVSYSYWKKAGSDPELPGKTLRINGRMFTVIGIAAEGFTGTTALVSSELYLPLGTYSFLANELEGGGQSLSERGNPHLILIGRLKSGITYRQADAQLAVVASQLAKAFPVENANQTFIVRSLSRLGVSPNPRDDRLARVAAILLMSMPGVVLLIASLNLANMMLARGAARSKEIAIRLAIGGSRGRIVRQLWTEGFLLSIVGGAAGLLAAYWGSALLMKSFSQIFPFDVVYSPGPDFRVLAATMAFCTLSTIVFGLWPAWKLSKLDVTVDLKSGGEDVGGGMRRLFSRRNMLVIAQLALSLMMLTAGGLCVRSALRAAGVQPGFSIENELVAEVDPSLAGYSEIRGRQIYGGLLTGLKNIPAVESVSLAWTVPFGDFTIVSGIRSAGESPQGVEVAAHYNIVTGDYFNTMGIPLLRGRSFLPIETGGAAQQRVAVIDKFAADQLWPKGEAVGKHLSLDSFLPNAARKEFEVVGVVGDVREHIIGGPLRGHLYVPFGPEYRADMHIHVRVAASGSKAQSRMLETVRQKIRDVDNGLPVLEFKTLRIHLDQSLDLWLLETGARILAVFATIALLLAVIGLYGVRVYTVACRTREIGIRMALGASSRNTQRKILWEGFVVTAIGVGGGLILALALGRVLAGFLYDVRSVDLLVLSIAILVLTAVSMVACYLPARKAARVDPMVALRYE